MSVEDLPGYKIATDLGYGLYSHGAERNSADYMKGPLTLRIESVKEGGLQASLMAMNGLVKLGIGPFTFPHRHFPNFVFQMLKLLPKKPA